MYVYIYIILYDTFDRYIIIYILIYMYNIAKRFAEVNLAEIPRQNLRKVEWLVDLSSQPRVEWAFVGRPSNSRGSVLLYHRQKLTLVACDTPASFSSSNISSGESWWIMVNPFHSDSVTGRIGDPSIAQCYCAGMSSPRARKFASWTDWAWCAVSCGCTEEMSNIFAIADLSIPFHTYLRYSQITIEYNR